MKKLLMMALATMLSLGLTSWAKADYPDGPVQFIVPWPPGDFEDILTRMIAKNMQEKTGVAATVVNRPGGGDGPFPGALEVLNAPNDGSCCRIVRDRCSDCRSENRRRHRRGQLRARRNLPDLSFVLAAGADAPYSDMAGLAAHAKNNNVVLGHFGAGLDTDPGKLRRRQEAGIRICR